MLNSHVRNCSLVFASVVVLCSAGAAFAQAGRNQDAVPVVRGAPISGVGVVTVTTRLYDGTRTERTVPAKYFRDSEGRVRREQTVLGLEALDPTGTQPSIVTIVDPVAQTVFVLMTETREAQRMPFEMRAFASNQPYPAPVAPGVVQEEPLGTRSIDGIDATGRRTRLTIPPGKIGNDRPIEVTDERWESPDLKVLLLSRYHDPRTGDVEYRLTNVDRAEPSPDLFTVPSDYRVVQWSTPPRVEP